MQVSNRFTMALHMFACAIAFEGTGQKMTSEFMAAKHKGERISVVSK